MLFLLKKSTLFVFAIKVNIFVVVIDQGILQM